MKLVKIANKENQAMTRKTERAKRKAKRAAKAMETRLIGRLAMRMIKAGKKTEEILEELGPAVEDPAVIKELKRLLAKQTATAPKTTPSADSTPKMADQPQTASRGPGN